MISQRNNEVLVIHYELVKLNDVHKQVCYSLKCTNCKIWSIDKLGIMYTSCAISGNVWSGYMRGFNISDKLEIKR